MDAEEIFKQWQTARTKALSEMLDNPDDCGIYPTGKYFNKIDGLFMGYLTKYTNSKLSKIVKEIENQKEEIAHCESDEEVWNDGLDRAIEIIKKELTKKN